MTNFSEDRIRELTLERANLINSLSEARRLLAASSVYIDFLVDRHSYLADAAETNKVIKAFLAAGIFGDKVVEEKAA